MVFYIVFLRTIAIAIAMPSLHRTRTRDAPGIRESTCRISYRERVEILSLRNYSMWSYTQISTKLSIPRSTVRRIIQNPQTPRKPQGRLPLLNTPLRQRLVKRATIDGYYRRLCLLEVAQLENIDTYRRTLVEAFKKECFFRRVATEKPLLTEAHKQVRLLWAYTHVSWTLWQWSRVIWTDECSIACSYGQVYVTRRAEEKYDLSCCVPKFRGYSACMVWACITSEQKGPLVMLEGRVNGEVYRENVVPVIYRFRKGVQNPILMEDGASIYTAKDTRKLHHQYNGIHLLHMTWPANSLDLNPIENVWRLLKYRIGKRFPKTAEQVR